MNTNKILCSTGVVILIHLQVAYRYFICITYGIRSNLAVNLKTRLKYAKTKTIRKKRLRYKKVVDLDLQSPFSCDYPKKNAVVMH